MSTRPSPTAAVGIVAAAAILVGGASLASYAASAHGGAGAAAGSPKTMVFTLGSPGKTFLGNTTHLYSTKVPRGTYSVSTSGIAIDQASGSTSDGISCVIADKKTLTYILTHSGSLRGAQRLYQLFSSNEGDDNFGILDQTTPAARIDRTSIVYGCTFNGTGPFEIARPVQITLTPVKVTHEKQGKPYALPASKVGPLIRAFR